MTTFKPESLWRSTIAQTVLGAAFLLTSAWYARGYAEDLKGEIRALRQDVTAIRDSMAKQYVTQSQAERYAAAFRWENRGQGLVVPDVLQYRDPVDNRIQ